MKEESMSSRNETELIKTATFFDPNQRKQIENSGEFDISQNDTQTTSSNNSNNTPKMQKVFKRGFQPKAKISDSKTDLFSKNSSSSSQTRQDLQYLQDQIDEKLTNLEDPQFWNRIQNIITINQGLQKNAINLPPILSNQEAYQSNKNFFGKPISPISCPNQLNRTNRLLVSYNESNNNKNSAGGGGSSNTPNSNSGNVPFFSNSQNLAKKDPNYGTLKSNKHQHQQQQQQQSNIQTTGSLGSHISNNNNSNNNANTEKQEKLQNLQYSKNNKLKPIILRTYSRDNIQIKVLNNDELPVENRVNSAKMIGLANPSKVKFAYGSGNAQSTSGLGNFHQYEFANKLQSKVGLNFNQPFKNTNLQQQQQQQQSLHSAERQQQQYAQQQHAQQQYQMERHQQHQQHQQQYQQYQQQQQQQQQFQGTLNRQGFNLQSNKQMGTIKEPQEFQITSHKKQYSFRNRALLKSREQEEEDALLMQNLNSPSQQQQNQQLQVEEEEISFRNSMIQSQGKDTLSGTQQHGLESPDQQQNKMSLRSKNLEKLKAEKQVSNNKLHIIQSQFNQTHKLGYTIQQNGQVSLQSSQVNNLKLDENQIQDYVNSNKKIARILKMQQPVLNKLLNIDKSPQK